MEFFAAAPGETILEIGCGTGHCLEEIVLAIGRQGRGVSVDISENKLDETRKLISTHEVELHCCDARQLPFDDAEFDGIFMSFTLELFDTPELPHVLREWQRTLKPGGRLVVVSISKAGSSGPVLKALEWTHRHLTTCWTADQSMFKMHWKRPDLLLKKPESDTGGFPWKSFAA